MNAAAPFRSILWRDDAVTHAVEATPDFFGDLGLDKIVADVIGWKYAAYDLAPFFHAPLDDADEIAWMRGGTYQVARKIEMNIEIWDADRVSDQENVFGRSKAEGAPLSGKKEFDTPNFTKAVDGKPVMPPTSHVALASPENNNGVRILRRSYNYTDGINQYGQLDAGLLFIAYMNDPAHFIALQTKLGSSDLLNEYISHIGSAIFAVPPAPAKGHYLGEALFA